MFDTLEGRLKKLEEDISKSESFIPSPAGTVLTGVRATERRPDAVSTLLLCPDHIELYGVQQLSGAVAPLEEKQTR